MMTTAPMSAKVPLVLEPQPQGEWTVTSPLLSELITEGDSIEEIRKNVQDCFSAIVEMYEDMGARRLAYCWSDLKMALKHWTLELAFLEMQGGRAEIEATGLR